MKKEGRGGAHVHEGAHSSYNEAVHAALHLLADDMGYVIPAPAEIAQERTCLRALMNMAPLPDVVRRNDQAEEDSAGLVSGGVAEREPVPSNSSGTEDANRASLEAMEDAFYREPCRILAEEHGLTPRELDVLRYLAQDKTLGQIAEGLVLSRNTVKMHTKHVYQKLEVHVGEWDPDIVSDAIRREMQRGGQVYYVSNRVRTIEDALDRAAWPT